jgi:hypothetical protein
MGKRKFRYIEDNSIHNPVHINSRSMSDAEDNSKTENELSPRDKKLVIKTLEAMGQDSKHFKDAYGRISIPMMIDWIKRH